MHLMQIRNLGYFCMNPLNSKIGKFLLLGFEKKERRQRENGRNVVTSLRKKNLEKALKIAPKLCKYVNLWIRWGYVSQFSRRSERHYSLTAISRLTRRTASEFIAQWSRLIIMKSWLIIINLLHCTMNSDAVLFVSREIAMRE